MFDTNNLFTSGPLFTKSWEVKQQNLRVETKSIDSILAFSSFSEILLMAQQQCCWSIC